MLCLNVKVNTMKRNLTTKEIDNLVDFIKPNALIPPETANSVMIQQKQRLIKQLVKIEVHPEIIPKLKEEIELAHATSLIAAGECVGIVCAQSIGHSLTQKTLDSVDWTEKILISERDDTISVKQIGEWIDGLFDIANPKNIEYIEKNKTEYLKLDSGYLIPSCDANGITGWHAIEAITRHLPGGPLVKIVTQSGRSVCASQSKSFLVWNGLKFVPKYGSKMKVGDIVPTTSSLPMPEIIEPYFHLESIFPKSEYLYTTEVVKARECRETSRCWWLKNNGINFVTPYNRSDTLFGRREYFETCEPGFVYLHRSKTYVSHFPEKIPLDNDFGFFIGIYLADGWVTKTFMGVSNKDVRIRKRISDYCDRYGVTYRDVYKFDERFGTPDKPGSSIDIIVHSVLFARLMLAICGTGSKNKRVPEFAYNAPPEFIKGMIDGYFSGDGSVNKDDGSITASSISETLITGMSFLLSYFGIFGKMSNRQQTKNNVGSKNIYRAYIIHIRNGYAKRFTNIIKLTERNKDKRLRSTLEHNYRYEYGQSQQDMPERDVYFDRVISVEEVESTTPFVYDLTVATTRNFQLYNGLSVRDSFHRAGLTEKAMTVGVPRCKELLSATSKPKTKVSRIFFKSDANGELKDLRDAIGHSIVGLTFNDISVEMIAVLDKEPEPWYDLFSILYEDKFGNLEELEYTNCIDVTLDMEKLYGYRLSLPDIANVVVGEYRDVAVVFSPPSIGKMHIYFDTNGITLPPERAYYNGTEETPFIYLEEVVIPILEKFTITGIPGISNIFYNKQDGEWIAEADGSNLQGLMAHPLVDDTRTMSNNVWDIFHTLGIEAARQFLLEEFGSIMDGINLCHPTLLFDRMTHGGSIASMSRYTTRDEESGPLGKASFEESMKNFEDAGARGDTEKTIGVSASTICGKMAKIGTGIATILIDRDRLPELNSDEDSEDEVIEKFERVKIEQKPIVKPIKPIRSSFLPNDEKKVIGSGKSKSTANDTKPIMQYTVREKRSDNTSTSHDVRSPSKQVETVVKKKMERRR